MDFSFLVDPDLYQGVLILLQSYGIELQLFISFLQTLPTDQLMVVYHVIVACLLILIVSKLNRISQVRSVVEGLKDRKLRKKNKKR